MLKIATMLLAVSALSLPAFSAPDAFVGTWKFNQEKSDLNSQTLKIDSLGSNQFRISITNAEACIVEDATMVVASFTIKTDGTEQSTVPGATWAVNSRTPNVWEVAYRSTRTTGAATWTLSADGKSLSVRYKGTGAAGAETTETFERVPGSTGFAGAWQKMNAAQSNLQQLQIAASTNGALAVSWPSSKVTVAVTLDGKDAPVEGPKVLKGTTASAKQVDAHTIRMTDKLDGYLLDTTDWKVSADGKVLTLTEHRPSSLKKTVVSVYDRQ